MGRIAVLSDIHANREALEAVLDDARARGCERFVCLGDIVGYGADPVVCLEMLRSLPCEVVLLGNHDAVAAGLEEPESFNDLAATAILWTRRQLAPEQWDWLAGLPLLAGLSLRAEGATDVVLAHASPAAPADWPYLWGPLEAAVAADAAGAPLVLVGHTHQVAAFRIDREEGARRVTPREVRSVPGSRHVINVGSVGQPRDGDPRAAYAVLDPDAGIVTIRRVDYDIATAQRKIRDVGLPVELADRLGVGR